MSESHLWKAGWYATRLHAVERATSEAASANRPIRSLCGEFVTNEPRTPWAAEQLKKGPPKCKRCVKRLAATT